MKYALWMMMIPCSLVLLGVALMSFNDTTLTSEKRVLPNYSAQRFEMGGHSYINFINHRHVAGDTIIHDPDCPCRGTK